MLVALQTNPLNLPCWLAVLWSPHSQVNLRSAAAAVCMSSLGLVKRTDLFICKKQASALDIGDTECCAAFLQTLIVMSRLYNDA